MPASNVSAPKYDVLALGNAIVDLLAFTPEDFLKSQSVDKGAMTLIDEPRAQQLYGAMGPATIVSGGSAANTAVGAASLGARVAFIGKVKADDVGDIFTHDIRATGVTFTTAPATDGPATARCFVLVTPDGQRSMNTYLGACQNLTVADVDADLVRESAIVYLEGYLWDPPAAKEAFVKAAEIAHGAGRRVALTLSDAFCVGRYRAEFLDLMHRGIVDIVFANEDELLSLYETTDFDAAVALLGSQKVLGVVTRSAQGAIAVAGKTIVSAPAFPIKELVDTTGAGDLFAAGFLSGLARGRDPVACLQLGALAAAEVIQHLGARPQVTLADLAKAHGLG